MNIKPLKDYILVEPCEPESITKSGIVLPESAQERPDLGLVLAVSEGSPVKFGQKVFFRPWSGNQIKVDGRELKVVKFDDLIAVYG